jgi:formylglycine-generating enzyme required for sulfatase activity
MPPEAFRGDISSAWDLWSLGIMLIQMTTNQLPYKFNNDNNQLMVKVINCELQIPSLPKEFKQIIEGCLQKDRRQRWTAQQVLNALQPLGWTSPPSPPPAPAAVKKPVSPIPLIASPTPFTENLPNRVTLEMVSLPAGEFLMGSPDSDPDASDDEKPQHQVKVNSFAIGKYPVTQAQYQAVMGTNPSHFKNNSWFKNNPQNPVENVSWNDAKAFCQKLSQITGKTYRLPTEAEWEYACRAGTTTRFYFGDDANQLGDYAWYKGNSQNTTHPVGQKKPNAWGLYDMSGNVWEWCEDDWHSSYIGAPTDGSAWIKNNNDNDYRILRGGSWYYYPNNCRSAFRLSNYRRVISDIIVGFRVVCGAGRTL